MATSSDDIHSLGQDTDEVLTPHVRLTLAQALTRIPERVLPDFWTGSLADTATLLHRVQRGEVRTIAETPGGRPVQVVVYGGIEAVAHGANFNSAIGGYLPAAYLGKASRQNPVLLIIGPVHGQETEGLVGVMNLIHIMETGCDLHGTECPELRALGEQCRLLLIPTGNPDGVARFTPGSLHGMQLHDIEFWGQGTWADHTLCGWPDCKRRHPMPRECVGFLGCYFNDAGINPMHDEFFNPMSAESAALLRLAQEEGPDLIVSLHSHGNAPELLRPAYVPLETQSAVQCLAREYYHALETAGIAHGHLFTPMPEAGHPPASFNLISALYHVCGAMAFTHECAHGTQGEGLCRVSFAQILAIELLLFETMMRHALAQKTMRPTAAS